MNNFLPPWWARNPHIQTILPLLTKVDKLDLRRERFELKDGDFIDLDWLGSPKDEEQILVIIHGLEGSAESHYSRRLLHNCAQRNLCALVHHHRSCSGESNRLARSYHSGDTQDLQENIQHLKQRFPTSQLLAVGYSLGGNILAKYLGEHGENSLLKRAAVISAPLKLSACAKRLERGFSKVYQGYLIKQLQRKATDKVNDDNLRNAMPVSLAQIKQLNTFYKFDNKITAPLHGFTGVDDYYQRSSGMDFLANISQPTLVLHSADDPFMTAEVIPTKDKISPHVTYELHSQGGHVGFINGGTPFKPKYYLEQRILRFLLESNN